MTSEEQATVKVYWLENSRAQRILWLLEELNIPYELETLKRNGDMLAPQDLSKIHPLGKSPVISINAPGRDEPVVLAESTFITEYLVSHWPEGKRLVPEKWLPGREGQLFGETEAWMKYEYYLHYVEGSFMPMLVLALVINQLKSNKVPFIVRPITSIVANRIISLFIFPTVKKHLTMINDQLASHTGRFLLGDYLTAIDILLSYPLLAGRTRFDDMGQWKGGSWDKEFPKIPKYLDVIEAEPGYKRCVDKIIEIEGEYKNAF